MSRQILDPDTDFGVSNGIKFCPGGPPLSFCSHRFKHLRTIHKGEGYRDLFYCEACLEYRHMDTVEGIPVVGGSHEA